MKKINLIVILILAIFICVLGLRGKVSGEKFDSTKWKTANLNLEENWSLRWDMMNSLRNDYKLIGMSKNQIINLLGKPDDIFSTNNDFIYYLGYSKTGINTGSLTLKFENGIVKEIEVWQG
ncbi:MAG: hypothetical protein IT222_00650 [Crocinitomix sp.]|nr:hypothetical protein [Crocinitomix sp.]